MSNLNSVSQSAQLIIIGRYLVQWLR